jgi:hypothetical protein
MTKLTLYQTAFWLSIFSGAITAAVFWKPFFLVADRGALSYLVMAVALPFGLWIASNFARGIGVLYLIASAGALLWGIISSDYSPSRLPLAAAFVLLAGINLATAVILALSKGFAAEWAKEREQQPKYKYYLRFVLLYGSLCAALVATFNDIIHLASQ